MGAVPEAQGGVGPSREWEQSLGVWSAEGRTERTVNVTWAQVHVTGTHLCSVRAQAGISAQILWQLVHI